MAACVTACVSACSSCCFGAFLLARCEDRHDAIMMRSPCEDDTEDASVHAGGGREKKYKSCDDALCSCCHSLSCPTPPSVCAFVICRVSSTSVWRCLSSLSPAALLSIYRQMLVRARARTHARTHTHTERGGGREREREMWQSLLIAPMLQRHISNPTHATTSYSSARRAAYCPLSLVYAA
eukprot:Tamp_10878.p1 GENE.Tamp_10878~~Tamp_10878.p1  ORF type:complete len:181 (+),score=14.43 Tamp_10878:1071-1613(+)